MLSNLLTLIYRPCILFSGSTLSHLVSQLSTYRSYGQLNPIQLINALLQSPCSNSAHLVRVAAALPLTSIFAFIWLCLIVVSLLLIDEHCVDLTQAQHMII